MQMDSQWIYVILSFVISVAGGCVIIPRILKFCMKRKLYDMPNARKVHTFAIPRLGGIAFMPCMLFAFFLSLLVYNRVTGRNHVGINMWTCSFVISLFILYTVGFVDDVIGLGPKTKFAAQIVAASLLPASGLYINSFYGFCGIDAIPFWIGAPLTVFVIVYVDNAMNLIDGIDGLSGGLALLSLAGFLVCFGRAEVWTYCVLIAGMMGVITAYLYFNMFGKADKGNKVFMGDSGSLTIGFILGFLAVKYSMDGVGNLPRHDDGLLLSYTLLIVPCFDVVRVVLSRLRASQPLFKADKRHIHHKLLAFGLSQHKALVVILLLQLFFVVINMSLFGVISLTILVFVDIVVYTVFNVLLTHGIEKRKRLVFSVFWNLI